MRINKFLSENQICSRREADKLIESKRIKINDRFAVIGDQVLEDDLVYVDNVLVSIKEEDIYLILNKPKGIVSTTNEKIKNNLITFMNYPKRIFNVGRLDKDSEGLLLMTSDGNIVNKILRSKYNHEKEYLVKVNKKIDANFINKMENGIPILDKITKKTTINKVDDYTFTIVLTEGLNRQIRRMCEYLGYSVVSLKRFRLINLYLDIPVGSFRELRMDEKKELFKIINYNK